MERILTNASPQVRDDRCGETKKPPPEKLPGSEVPGGGVVSNLSSIATVADAARITRIEPC